MILKTSELRLYEIILWTIPKVNFAYSHNIRLPVIFSSKGPALAP